MPDKFGRPLRAGDMVVYGSTQSGLMYGELKFDEEEKAKYHILMPGRLWVDGKYIDGAITTRHYNKGRGPNDKWIINLTSYARAEFDKTFQV